MFNKVILIGRLGQTRKPKPLRTATQESWKNDKGEHETRTEWHRVYA